FMFPAERIAAGAVHVAAALALAEPQGRDALDLCCGPGRCSIPLARAGYQVTGVDRAAFLVTKARTEARRAGVSGEWVQADMREFRRPRAFDFAISMFTSFGYFEDERENQRVLEQVYGALRPGGVFFIDLAGKEWLARVFDPCDCDELEDGSMLV